MKKKNILFCLSVIGLITAGLSQDNSRRVLTTGPFTGIKTYSNIEVNLISSDVKIVATSMSSISSPERCFLTQPPTNLATTFSFGKSECNFLNKNFNSLFL